MVPLLSPRFLVLAAEPHNDEPDLVGVSDEDAAAATAAITACPMAHVWSTNHRGSRPGGLELAKPRLDLETQELGHGVSCRAQIQNETRLIVNRRSEVGNRTLVQVLIDSQDLFDWTFSLLGNKVIVGGPVEAGSRAGGKRQWQT